MVLEVLFFGIISLALPSNWITITKNVTRDPNIVAAYVLSKLICAMHLVDFFWAKVHWRNFESGINVS